MQMSIELIKSIVSFLKLISLPFLRWVVALFSRWHSSDSPTWCLGAWRDVTFKATGGNLLQRVDTEQDSYLVYLSTRDTRPSAGLCCEVGDMMRRWCICENKKKEIKKKKFEGAAARIECRGKHCGGRGCHAGANCTSGAILGFSILLKDTSTCSSVPPQGEPGFEPGTFRSLVHQLYPATHWATATAKQYVSGKMAFLCVFYSLILCYISI